MAPIKHKKRKPARRKAVVKAANPMRLDQFVTNSSNSARPGKEHDPAARKSIPTTFTPRFWEDADRRCKIVRDIEERVAMLKDHCGADSRQREVLCERAAFLILLLETAEVGAIVEGGKFDPGSYTQSVNALLGLLKSLGLEKANAKKLRLHDYVRGAA